MATKVQVTIATAQDVYDYAAISATAAAAAMPSGAVLSAYISKLLQRTGDLIAHYINYDYTVGQVFHVRSLGNGTNQMRLDHPVTAINIFKSWDPTTVTAATINIGGGAITVLDIDPNVIFRNDGSDFSRSLMYLIEYVQAADDNTVSGWPEAIKQIQVEWVGQIYKESWNLQGSLDWASEPDVDRGQRINLRNMPDEFKVRLQPYKHYMI